VRDDAQSRAPHPWTTTTEVDEDMTVIGFVGPCVMSRPMAANPVHVRGAFGSPTNAMAVL
jgi:hypothetical protein